MIKIISFQLTFFILALCFGPALLADDAMISYYETDIYSPKYRTWDGSSWGGEGSCSNVGGRAYWVVLKSHPTSTEKILGTIDHLYDVNVQVWDGAAWGNIQQATGSGSTYSYRSFDVAYEQSSKDGMVVYGFNNLTSMGFRTWSGSSWSSESTFLIGATDEIEWVTLASKPESDEILGGFQDKNARVYSAVWDGTTWGNATWCEQTTEKHTTFCVDVAYEHGGDNEGIVVWGDKLDDKPRYRIWDGSNWSAMSYAVDQGATDILWVKLAPDPNSDDILLGIEDDGQDVNVQVWNGQTWGNYQQVEDTCGDDTEKLFDVAYESSSGDGIVVWADNSTIPKYRLWTGSWGSEASASTIGATVKWIQLAPDPASDSIMLMTSDDQADLNAQEWGGSSWAVASELQNNPSSSSMCFSGVYSPGAAPTPAPRSTFSIW